MSGSDPPPEKAGAMKAVLTDERFSDPDWIFERKLDGVRCVAIRDGDSIRLLSRNDLSMNDRYPEIAEALASDPCRRFALDGEVVAFDGAQTSFAALGAGTARRFLYAFDITWLDGEDVRDRPLRERKRLLSEAINFEDPVRLSTHRNENGVAMFAEACSKGWEGVIAKRADSRYTASRSRDWLKFKCEQGQELVIGGWTDPKGSRTEFGALLMGYFEAGELRYAGKVGTGFDHELLALIGAKLGELATDEPAFAEPDAIRPLGDRHWVSPELVAQIGFTEWTKDGRLRHPRFQGLREDKPARKVVRES